MPRISKVNSWDEFSPLKTMILGSVFDTNFFDAIKNQKIQYALKKVFQETQEDLEAFKTTMESHGIKVHQAGPWEMGYKDSIMDYIDDKGRIGWTGGAEITRTNLVPAPPLQVRDETIVMGNEVFVTEGAFTVRPISSSISLSILGGTFISLVGFPFFLASASVSFTFFA